MLDGIDYDRLHYAEQLIQDSRERWPWAWRGCVGAWAPSMGRTGGTLLDWSGRRNHGTLVNGPLWTPGRDGYSLSFNGVNNYVQYGLVNELKIHATGTVSAWIKTTGNFGVILSLNDQTTNLRVARFYLDGGKPSLRIDDGGPREEMRADMVVSDGALHNVAVMSDGAETRFYVDGLSVAVLAISGSNTGAWFNKLTTATSVTTGVQLRQDGITLAYAGLMDDMRLYNRALHAEGMLSLHRIDCGGLYRFPQRPPVVRSIPERFSPAQLRRKRQHAPFDITPELLW